MARAVVLAASALTGIAEDCGEDGSCANLVVQGPPCSQYPRLPAIDRLVTEKVWSVTDLALHNGHDCTKPLLLAIVGQVFDVGTGKQYYEPAGGYAGAAGRDSSRSFATGDYGPDADASNFDEMAMSDIDAVLHWQGFYVEHETYRFVGVLNERYYDADGKPTAEFAKVEKLKTASTSAEQARKAMNDRFMSCNSRSGAAIKTELWCDDSYHVPGSVPVHLYYTLPNGDTGNKCGCIPKIKRAELDEEAAEMAKRPSAGQSTFRLVDYPECDGTKQSCKRPQKSQPP